MKASDFVREVDAIVRDSLNGPNALKPCCSKGCSTCCSEALMSNKSEVEYILEGYPEEKLPELKRRTEEWFENFKPFQHAEVRDGIINGFAYLEKDIKCPFLEGNLCSVYERRPVGCRVYMAQGNPENCKMPNRFNQLIADYDFSHPRWTRLFHSMAISTGEFYMDHMGIHLYNLLFNTNIETSVSVKYKVS